MAYSIQYVAEIKELERKIRLIEWLYYDSLIDRLVLVYTCKPLTLRTSSFVLVGVL